MPHTPPLLLLLLLLTLLSAPYVAAFGLGISTSSSGPAASPAISDELRASFAKKVVLVTGGSSGIGYATALAFARGGALVTFCARDSRPDWYNGATAEKQINADPDVIKAGGKARFVKADVSNATQVRFLIKSVVDTHGTLDIAINNAGIGGWLGNIDTIPDNLPLGPHDPIHNNLYGVYNCMHEQVKYWTSSGRKDEAIIVNLSSLNGLKSCPGCSMYAASKYGIIGLTKSVALEFVASTPKIRVNAVAPGLIDTPLTRNQAKFVFEGVQPWVGPLITEDNPLWKKFEPLCQQELAGHVLGRPDQMAAIILFLSSKEASYITGTVVSGDNGDGAV